MFVEGRRGYMVCQQSTGLTVPPLVGYCINLVPGCCVWNHIMFTCLEFVNIGLAVCILLGCDVSEKQPLCLHHISHYTSRTSCFPIKPVRYTYVYIYIYIYMVDRNMFWPISTLYNVAWCVNMNVCVPYLDNLLG